MRWRRARALAVAIALGGLGAGCGGSENGEAVRPEAAGWERVASMSQRRSYIAAAELAGLIYTAGGMVGETGRPLATFSRYDPRADEWTTLPQLPDPTRAAAAAGLGDEIYVVGGTTAEGDTAAVWAWDGKRWRARAPLPVPRFNHVVVTLGGRLYSLGGLDGRGRLTEEVYAYERARDRWTLATRLPRPNHAFGAVAFRGELWTIGGRRGNEILDDVWIWNPRTGRWRRGPTLPRPMELLGTAVAGDRIHAVWESVYQVYDASTGTWSQGPHTKVTRHALEAFALDGRLYAIGGCTTGLRDSPVVERLVLPG